MTKVARDVEALANLSNGVRFLTPQLVCQVEDALTRVSPFGEVRLVVQRGKLRFIEVVQSQAVDASTILVDGDSS